MAEDIGKIISNGFETYTKNLNLGIPFVLNFFITGLLAVIMLGIGFFYLFGASLSSLKNAASPQDLIFIILPIITQHLFELVVLMLIFFLITTFLQSFFVAGAIGMAQQATETGKSEMSAMTEAGKKNVVNLYLAEILVGLLYLAGIVFIIPGAMKFDITQLLSSKNPEGILLLLGGVLLWVVYSLILSLMLAVFSYALVADTLNPVDGILTGFRFFNKHRFDVFLLWLFIGVIVIVFAIFGELMRLVPVMNIIWPFINMLISIVVIPPLTTLWWVRLYMTRTGKKIYFNELLAHPNDLEKLRASQQVTVFR